MLELNAKFDLKLYLLDPGDEVFAPMNIWPIKPIELRISKKNVYAQIEVKKQSRIAQNDCTAVVDYHYGGKRFKFNVQY